jgi:Mg/Co/Ni transporter MgtE
VIGLASVDGLTAADIVHRRLSTLPSCATVADLRDYFAESQSRNLALLVDGERFAGSLTPADIPADAEPSAPATSLARTEPTISAGARAREARDAALADPSARMPVVGENGTLIGVVAINHARDGFCGT